MDRFFKILSRALAVLFVLSFAILAGFVAIVIPTSSRGFYKKQFLKPNEEGKTALYLVRRQTYDISDIETARFVIDMTEDELVDVMMHAVRYCFYLEDDLNPTVDGYQMKLYREDEISHMQDVKGVFGGGLIMVGVSLAVFITGLCLALIKKKSYYLNCRKVPVYALIGVLLGLLAVGIFSLANFDFAFDAFHKIFFDGNWEFETGIMIEMIGYLFDDILPIILSVWLGLLAVFGVAIYFFNRFLKKKFK
ncbi:MAG: DUF1461 domain-containing protein [Clostridia bacterium]|nr:DUF1461 domain-containing protein [Clostridia bacterium]